MADDVYSNPGTKGFDVFISKYDRIIIAQDAFDGTIESIELNQEEAEDLAYFLKKLAKDLRKKK